MSNTCPKCKVISENSVDCSRCGINFSGYHKHLERKKAGRQNPLVQSPFFQPNTADGNLSTEDPSNRVNLSSAAFWIRFRAYVLDIFLESLFLYIGIFVLGGSDAPNVHTHHQGKSLFQFLGHPAFPKTLLLEGIYLIFWYKFFNATPGKLKYGLRVIDIYTGEYLGPIRVLIRELILRRVSAFIFGMGYLMAMNREDSMALHDLLGNTKVVVID